MAPNDQRELARSRTGWPADRPWRPRQSPVKRSAEYGFTSSMRSAQQGFTSSMRSAEHGFTLLEMLVALAIFSLAALALVRLQAVSARTSADLRARTMGQIVARNLMIERLTDPHAPALGGSEGVVENAGRKWAWAQRVEQADNDRLLVLTIRVDGGPGQSPAVLTFGRPAR